VLTADGPLQISRRQIQLTYHLNGRVYLLKACWCDFKIGGLHC